MSDSQQVLIEFVTEDSQLDSSVDKLVSMGKLDKATADSFKKTNDQIQQRNTLLDKTEAEQKDLLDQANRQKDIYTKLTASLKTLTGASKTAVQELLKLSPKEVVAGFDLAAVSVDDYLKVLNEMGDSSDEADAKTQTLRAELKALTGQIADMILAGQEGTAEFDAIAQRAGKVRNALDDAKQTVSTLGQDLPTLQVFGKGITTISNSFTLLTGAQAAFGSENKDLQETLVRVNGVMAINAGLTELLNTLNDEALIASAKSIIAQKIKNAQIAIENGLNSQSVIVRTAATIAQLALNAAIALNPIGIAAIALAAFIAGIIIYTSNAKKAAAAQNELNAALASASDLLDAEFQGFDNANKKILAGLEARNARQSEIDAQEIATLKIRNAARLREIQNLNVSIEKNQNSSNAETLKAVAENRKKLGELESQAYDARTELISKETLFRKQQINEQFEDQANSIQARLSLAAKNSNAEFSLQRQLAKAQAAQEVFDAGDNAEKVKAIRSKLARELKDIDIAQAKIAQDSIAAGLQSALINAQNESRAINDRESQEELTKQLAIIKEQADFDVKQEGLTQNQKQLIRDTANQKSLELQREFNKQQTINALQDQISLNNVVLGQVETGEKEKLDVRTNNIILAASIEIEENRGKVDKIKEIEAKRDADIKAARLQSIEDTLQKELAAQEVLQAGTARRLQAQLDAQDEINNAQGLNGGKEVERLLGVQRLSVDRQKQLIDELTAFKLEAIDKEQRATDEEFAEGLISFNDYVQKSLELEDKGVQAHEDAERKKTDITFKEIEKRKARNQEIFKDSLQALSDGIGVLAQFYQQDADADNARIESQRQHIQDLSDVGAITAKEASARNKKLDVEQKQLQIQQARRQKELDLFQAILNTALGITNALTSGDPYTAPFRAAVAGAIGGAQVALIASKPLPQFGKGKKSKYEGYAEIGETGPELIKRKGRYYLENEPTVKWIGANDIVYNPKETLEIMNRQPTEYLPSAEIKIPKSKDFDYVRMGKEVGKNISRYGLGADDNGLFEYELRNSNFKKYLNGRRSWGSR